MIDGGIRGGTPREIIIDGTEYEPAADSELTYNVSGRSGPVMLAGNGVAYGNSKPHPASVKQDISVDAEKYAKLCKLQSSGRFVTISLTDAGNNVFYGLVKINNDGALENANGVVSLELAGTLEPA